METEGWEHALPKAAGNPADMVRNVPGQHTETGSSVKCQGGMETQGRAWHPASLPQPLLVGSGAFPEDQAVIPLLRMEGKMGRQPRTHIAQS